MFIYKRDMQDGFRFPFPGLETVETSYSQALQDMFVLSVLGGKTNGTFLEIGAHDPVYISNTYLLESRFGWKGISIDIDPAVQQKFRDRNRTAFCVCQNAIEVDYSRLLAGHMPRMDYLTLDIEPNLQTLECLTKLPLDRLRFSVITFETDVYNLANGEEAPRFVLAQSRKLLKHLGYVLVAGNIANLEAKYPFEDWYVDGTFLDRETVERFRRPDDSPIPAHEYMLRDQAG